MAEIKLIPVPSKNGLKTYYTLEWGKAKGQRKATGIYTWTNPKNGAQKNFNKEQLAILEIKKSQLTITKNSVGTSYIPSFKRVYNFLDFFEDFVNKNEKPEKNRSLSCCLEKFKKFLLEKERKTTISPQEITVNLCERFQQYLLDTLNGETPADYFRRFRRVMKAATSENHFLENPAKDITCKGWDSLEKEVLTGEEVMLLLKAHCPNNEVKRAAIVSLYTGLRWCDIHLRGWQITPTHIIIKKQTKTKAAVQIPLHPIASEAIGSIEDPRKLIFDLPTPEGANWILGEWVKKSGINKHITWHCLRHTTADLMLDKGVDVMTVSKFLGHKTAKQVLKRYKKRVAASDLEAAVNVLPS